MTLKYDLKNFRPTQLTTDKTVAKSGLITDGELYYHLNSCPFFHTYNDGRVEESETILLPFFRRFLKNRMSGPISFVTSTGEFNEYLTNSGHTILPKDLKKYYRFFNNFYSLLHPSKKFEILLPYFPYKYNYLTGCAELVIKSKAGIRLYVYDFTEEPIDAEGLNYNGFRLQLAARILDVLGGIAPTSLACLYPSSKNVVYYTYNAHEELEKMITTKDQFVRRYGSHCAYCLEKNCSPLIDSKDQYGWKLSDDNKTNR